jgi:arabinofuranosyltransferase
MGGDFMHARLLLPGLAAIFSALGVLPFRRAPRWQAAGQAVAFGALFAWVVVCATSLRVARENEFGIGDERGWFARESGVPNPVDVEDYQNFVFYTEMLEPKRDIARGCPHGELDLQASSRVPCDRYLVLLQPLADGAKMVPLREGAVPPEVVAVKVVGPLGIPAAVLGLRIHVVDAFGLADPIGARVQLNGRGRPGHEKVLPDVWRAARYAVLSSTRDPEVQALSEVLACPPLDALIRAVSAPMSPGRFWENIKLSFAFHRLRLATDSRQAREQLCVRSL